MKKLNNDEMKQLKGGYCATFHSYYFCCPATTAELQKTLREYQNGRDQNKPSRYVQFCYEECGYN